MLLFCNIFEHQISQIKLISEFQAEDYLKQNITYAIIIGSVSKMCCIFYYLKALNILF